MKITNEQYEQFLSNNGLDYTVNMIPQVIKVPAIDDNGNLVQNTEKEINVGFCPVRTDTMQPLSNGGLSKQFVPIQNREAFSVIPALSDVTDINLIKGNTWGGGAGTYAQISLGGMKVGNGDDYVGKYLSVVNSHDGSQAMRVLITPYRFWCKNQIAPAINDATENVTMISIRHNISASEQLDRMIETVHIADEVFKYSEEVYNDLESKRITAEYVEEVISRMYPKLPTEATERMRRGRMRKIDATLERFNNADGHRDEIGYHNIQQDPNVFNAWNLYNAVQGTFQHDSKNTENKDKSVIMGNIATKSQTALAVVTEVCSSEHVPQSVLNEIDELTQ